MYIHREGKTILFALLVVLGAINYGLYYFFPENQMAQDIVLGLSAIFYLIILQFFRIPVFEVKQNENQILSPADGKVVVIENTVENEYFKDERIQLSIFMSPINVHNNRTPVSGVVKSFKYHAGKYLVAWHPKSSTENERTTMVVKMQNGVEILVRQIAGAMARRIKYYVKEGQPLHQGQEYGFIKFGSRVDVFLPLDAKVLVKPDQKTKGGRTVLAEFA